MNIKVILTFIFILILAKVLYTDTPLRATLAHYSHIVVVWTVEKPYEAMKIAQRQRYLRHHKKRNE